MTIHPRPFILVAAAATALFGAAAQAQPGDRQVALRGSPETIVAAITDAARAMCADAADKKEIAAADVDVCTDVVVARTVAETRRADLVVKRRAAPDAD